MVDVTARFALSAGDTIIETGQAFLVVVDQIATAAERYEKALGDAVTQIEHTRASGFSPDEVVSHAERISRERSLSVRPEKS